MSCHKVHACEFLAVHLHLGYSLPIVVDLTANTPLRTSNPETMRDILVLLVGLSPHHSLKCVAAWKALTAVLWVDYEGSHWCRKGLMSKRKRLRFDNPFAEDLSESVNLRQAAKISSHIRWDNLLTLSRKTQSVSVAASDLRSQKAD